LPSADSFIQVENTTFNLAQKKPVRSVSLPRNKSDRRLAMIEALPDRLRDEAKPLALEARRHLGLLEGKEE
jgi:hypothetical protein